MQKILAYTLAWSPTKETYELYQKHDREVLKVVPESPAWHAWLDQVSSFAFSGKCGHFTVRKEAKQCGDWYWSAYLATGERLTKKPLGKTADLTLARLEHIADMLSDQCKTKLPPPLSPASGADGGEAKVPPLLLAQQGQPLHPLLATKLHVPRPRTHFVLRSHLVELLQRGVERALTLVSAPAGFGKTTLLTHWLAQCGTPVAWLSLEAEDNDPTRFLSYLIAALQTVDAEIGKTALALLRSPRPPAPEAVLAVLIGDMTHHDRDIALVLDDYHVITAESIQRGMTFLLEHIPPQLHLILASRADPLIPLARLRAQGQLTELRTADLRFGANEVTAFLRDVMGLDLEAEDIATLEQRTEGWIAGLQLAALSLQGRTDVSRFLATFSGSHRYVLDYLSEEVFSQQSAVVQSFLLSTCILERLSGPLCDAVRGQEGSQAMLEALERANLFVVALDDERGWYRYHHLFAEALHSHLRHTEPTLLPELHRRASAWFEQHDLPAEAVQHALAAPDVELAARLIEPIAVSTIFQGQLYTMLEWLNTLPEAVVQARPFLCLYHAYALTVTNQLEAAEARLQDAERSAQRMPAEQVQTISGWIHYIRALTALLSSDIPRAVTLACQSLELLPEVEIITRAGALATTTRSYLVSGDVTPESEREVAAVVEAIRISGNRFALVSSICLLARLHSLQGRLRHAAATYAQVVQVVPQPEVLQTMFSSLFYSFGLGDLLRERNELDAAEQYLAQGMKQVNETLTAVEPAAAMLGYTAQARLRQARGNSSEALATLDRLANLAKQRHFSPHLLTQVAAVRAELELAQGNLAAAIRWANSCSLSTEDDDVSYPRERAYLAFARVRIAQARSDPATLADIAGHPGDVPRNRFAPPDGPRASEEAQALRVLHGVLCLLDRLLQEAETKARKGSVLEILVLRALALDALGDRTSALSVLGSALVLAAPEGYIRLFVDEGSPMLALLRRAQSHSSVPGYVATLLSVFGEQHVSDLPLCSASHCPLVEPLTERERDVLRLLLEGASNREIARRLALSVNTIKRHVYNLSGKLGVQSRMQAIIRARTLNLL